MTTRLSRAQLRAYRIIKENQPIAAEDLRRLFPTATALVTLSRLRLKGLITFTPGGFYIANDLPLGQPLPLSQPVKNKHAAILGRRGGLIGGRARADSLTPEQRREIATKAARARWDKRR